MVKTAKSIEEGNPYFKLDLEKFKENCSYTVEEVEEALRSNIPHSSSDEESEKTEEVSLEKRKENFRKDASLKEYNTFQSNPELYTTLYSIKETTNNELYEGKEKSKAQICVDESNNLLLAVEIMKPIDVSFQIHDGKLSFDPHGMSKDQLKEILSYLDHRGLSSFLNLDELQLEDADQKIQEMFEDSKKEIKESLGEDKVYESHSDKNAEDDKVAKDSKDTSKKTSESNSGKAPDGSYDKAVAALNKWMNKNKRRGLSYFVTHEGGYTVFTAFEKENPENMQQDNVIDKKTKDIKTRHEIKFYVKMNKEGKLEVSYSLPAGKTLSDSYADRIMDAYKDAGIKKVKFGTLPDANEAAIRSACGRALIVPVGIKLSQTKFDKMIDAAEGKNGKNNPKVIKYRYELALQFAEQLTKKGIRWDDKNNLNNSDCRCVRFAIDAYNYAPFRDWWSDFGLRTAYDKIISENGSANPNGATATIGASMAVKKLYDAYGQAIYRQDEKVGYLVSPECKALTEEEKKEFKKYLNGREDMSIRSMPPEAAIELFHIMQKTQAEIAKKNIEDEYKKLNEDPHYRGNAARDAVAPYWQEANAAIDNVKTDMVDMGISPIYITRSGTPKHDFKEIDLANSKSRTPNHGRDTGRD